MGKPGDANELSCRMRPKGSDTRVAGVGISNDVAGEYDVATKTKLLDMCVLESNRCLLVNPILLTALELGRKVSTVDARGVNSPKSSMVVAGLQTGQRGSIMKPQHLPTTDLVEVRSLVRAPWLNLVHQLIYQIGTRGRISPLIRKTSAQISRRRTLETNPISRSIQLSLHCFLIFLSRLLTLTLTLLLLLHLRRRRTLLTRNLQMMFRTNHNIHSLMSTKCTILLCEIIAFHTILASLQAIPISKRMLAPFRSSNWRHSVS
jgi:hypothetical protein